MHPTPRFLPSFTLASCLALSLCASWRVPAEAAWLRGLSYDAGKQTLVLDAALQPGEARLPEPPTIMTSSTVSGQKRLIVQWNRVDVEASFPDNETLTARLKAQWPSLQQIRLMPFTQADESSVRMLIDLAADAPTPVVSTGSGTGLLAAPVQLAITPPSVRVTPPPMTSPIKSPITPPIKPQDAPRSEPPSVVAAVAAPVQKASPPPVEIVTARTPEPPLSPQKPLPQSLSPSPSPDQLAALQNGLDQARTQLAKAFETINRQNQQIESLKSTQTSLEANLKRQLTASSKPVEKPENLAKNQSPEQTKAIETLNQQIQRLQQENADLNQKTAQLTQKIERLDTEKRALSDQTEALKTRLAEKPEPSKPVAPSVIPQGPSPESIALVEVTQKNQALVRELEAQKEAYNRELETLKANKTNNQTQEKEALARAEQALSKNQQALAQTQRDLAAAQAELSKTAQANRDLTLAQTQIDTLKKDVQAQKAELQAKTLALTTERDQLAKKLALADADVAKAKAKKPAEVTQTLPALPSLSEAENKQLKLALAEEEARSQSLRDQLQKLQADKAPSAKPQLASTGNRQAAEQALAAAQAQADKVRQSGLNNVSPAALTQTTQAFRQAMKLDPTHPDIIAAYAEFQLETGKTTEAIALLDAAMVNPALSRNPQLVNLLGKAQLLSGQPQAAVTTYADGIPLALLSNYGLSLKNAGQLDKAEAVIKAALAIAPEDAELHFNLGNLYLESQRPQVAATEYQQALRFKQSFTEAHYNLGIALSQTGQNAQAAQHLEQYLSLSPKAENAVAVRQFIARLKAPRT